MNPIFKSLLVLSAIIGFVVSSPVEYKSLDTVIVPAAAEDVDYRLSRDVLPTKYVLKLTPYFENQTSPEVQTAFTFDGDVTITLNVVQNDTTRIVFHMFDLDVSSIVFTKGNFIRSSGFMVEQYENATDKYTFLLDQPISAGEATLRITYRGYMRDDMEGFYRSYYKEGSKKIWMASTQFQQTEARRAFPCFDEPGFKANFKLTLVIPADMKAISNTKIEFQANSTINGQLRNTVEFFETPKMSSYLLAFIVSNYRGSLNSDETFGVYARPEAYEETQFALDFGQKVLKQLGDYVGINYYSVPGITKLDMAAIPDFSAGAMENWGLATYRETGVLYYPQDTPSINQQRIAAVISHEQTHMWFGDLVTCNWWSETWLNEGFARYFQYFGTKLVEGYTDWDLEEQFVVENLQQSMQLDSTDSTHPMTDLTVKTKAQASAMFDNISYNKAASIIRMLSHYITMDKFKATLNHHLDRKRFENVVPDDLFTAITDINPGTGEVARWFAPWTQTPGFPLVTVELKNQSLILSQKRFMQSNINNTKTERYNIPITYTIDSENYDDTTPKVIFRIEDGPSKTIELPKKPQKYVILNPRQTNFYRVNYDEENWGKIKDALYKDNHDNIHVMNRAQIVDDLFNLARAGIVKYNTAVDIIRYIKKEKHYIPWLSAFSHGLTFLSQRVQGEKDSEVFEWFIKDLTDEIYKHLKFAPQGSDRRTDIYNRVNVATWACKYGHEDCVNDAKEAFKTFMSSPTTKPNKDQRSYIYCNGVRYGGKAEFDFLYNRFNDETIAAEQLNLLIGMACTKDRESVNKYLNRLINTDEVRPQDLGAAINNVLNSNPEGKTFLYDYITANAAAWKAKMGSLNTLSSVAGRFTTAEEFTKYEAFLNGMSADLGAKETLLSSLKSSKDKNLAWDETYMTEFMDHLKKLKNSAPVKAISLMVSMISLAVLFLFN